MQLIDEVRARAPAAYRARGVKLARQGVVEGVKAEASYGEEEITLRVVDPSARMAFTVTVWPEEPDWACDCPIEHDTCPHAVAAVIALVNARSRHGAGGQRALPPRAT